MNVWSKKMPDVIVVGAGLAGTVAARELAEAGKHVLVVEKRNHIGGNMYDKIDDNGILIHQYGPHIFHTNNEEVVEYLDKFGKWKQYQHRVKGMIKGTEVPIPFNFYSMENLFSAQQCKILQMYLQQYFGNRQRVSVLELMDCEEKVVKTLGHYIYSNVFEGYTIKQWGVSKAENVDRSVLERVPVVLGYDNRYFNDKIQQMPVDGYTALFENMLNHENIECWLNIDMDSIIKFEYDGTILLQGEAFKGIFVYTGMPDKLLQDCYGALPYRSLDLQFETIEKDSFQSVAVMNYPTSEVFTRITEFKKLTGQQKTGVTTILKEYPKAFEGKSGQEAYYPIENAENRALYEKYETTLTSCWNNLYLCGRLAEYKYYNMDAVVARALALVREILKKEGK